MENLTGSARAHAVQDIFTRIAPRYDLMNKVMTGGFDRSWRRFVVQKAMLPKGDELWRVVVDPYQVERPKPRFG